MTSARFPVHRDLAGFDFDASVVDQKLIQQLATLEFTEAAHNVVLVGGPGTGKTHLATARACRASRAKASACGSTRRST
jgi:DNA replication protein DnaC